MVMAIRMVGMMGLLLIKMIIWSVMVILAVIMKEDSCNNHDDEDDVYDEDYGCQDCGGGDEYIDNNGYRGDDGNKMLTFVITSAVGVLLSRVG